MPIQNLDVAVGQLLGDFDLVEIPGGVVINGGPEQRAEIANIPLGAKAVGLRLKVGQLLLDLRAGSRARSRVPS